MTALPREFNRDALGNVTPRYSWQIDPSKVKITGHEVMQKLADTRPIGIGSMGAGASGMRGRDPNAAANEHHEEHRSQRDPNSFGFAVWQPAEQRLILASDCYGTVPLFHCRTDGFIAVSTNPMALLALGGVPRDLDALSLAAQVSGRNVSGDRTLYRAIRRLPRASVAVFERTASRSSLYWQPRRRPTLRFPIAALYPIALGAEWFAHLTGKEPFATRDGLRMARHYMFFDDAKARRELGYTSRPYREGIADAIAWFKQAGYVR